MLIKFTFIILLVVCISNEKNNDFNITSEQPDKDALDIISQAAKDLLSNYPELASVIEFANVLRKNYIKKNNEDFKNLWDKKRDNLTKINIEKIKNKFNNFNFNESEENRILEEGKNKLKDIFEIEHEEIFDKILFYVSSDSIEEIIRNINKINVICLGRSQIGKTELINNILLLDEKEKGKVGGEGESTTMEDKTYSSKIIKHLQITDTRGIEQGDFNLYKWLNKYKNKMDNDIKEGKIGNLIHAIWYCVHGNLMNDDERKAIINISESFNGYNIPIIFVYTKPFEGDIETMEKRTNNISKLFLPVQSINFTKIINQINVNYTLDFNQYNMDKLLLLTKKVSIDGIINSIASKISFDVKEGNINYFEKKVDNKLKNYKHFLDVFDKKLQSNESYEKMLNKTFQIKSFEIVKIFNFFEEIFSNNQLSKISKLLILSIQNKIENEYYNKFIKEKEIILSKCKNLIRNEFISFASDYSGSDIILDDEALEEDLKYAEEKINLDSIASLYSLKKSYETFYSILKEHFLKIMDKKNLEIIWDKKFKNKLEKTIQKISNKKINYLIDELENEINSAFLYNKIIN